MKNKSYIRTMVITLITMYISQSCREDPVIIDPVITPVAGVTGFYLLNEGLMGLNNASLDYYDSQKKEYRLNIYGSANGSIARGLGDTGNDLQIYGGRLYAVMNGSNLVEVMNAATAKHITSFEVTNGRYIAFHNGKAYVSAYVAPVEFSPDAQLGAIYEYDTINYKRLREVIVGYQPEEMAIVGNKLYVANSGGYRFPDYDSTVSVVDLETFTVLYTIGVGNNLHHIEADADGDLYVSTRGDYYNETSNLYGIDTKADKVKKTFNIQASGLCISGDSLYVCSVEWSHDKASNTVSYTMINTKTEEVVNHNFITDDTDKNIKVPYEIAVDPVSKDIYITDAGNYVKPGKLYCFDRDGRMKWDKPHTTGDVPAHIVFVKK